MKLPPSTKQADARATPRAESSRAIQERTDSGFFTAGLVAAQRAERAGLINDLVPEANLETDVSALAKTMATRSTAVIKASEEMRPRGG
jgi:enoyl-CoA hydratase/carnithine racemase